MTDPTEPLPTEPPPDDAIEDDGFEFSLDDLNAVFTAEADDDSAADTSSPAGESEEPTLTSEDAATAEGGVDHPTGHAGDDTPLDAEPEPTPTPEPTPEPAAAQTGVVDIGGQLYRAEDVEQLIQYVSNLPADKQALLFGEPTPEPDPRTQLPAEDEIVDPRLAQWTADQFQTIEQKLDAIAQQQAVQQRALAVQQQSELEAALDTARRGVSEKYGLSDAEAEALMEAANRNPVATAAAQNAEPGADPVKVFTQVLDAAYWLTDEFRDRAIQNQATTLAAEIGVQTSLEEKRRLNSGLVGTGAAAPRQVSPAPSTPEEHQAAAVALVRESLSNN
jgi:hypothetical protein